MLSELVFKKDSVSGSMSEVEEVLQHAKDALARHHAWMSRRRNQRTVAPMLARENLPGDDTAAVREVQPTSWAVGTPGSEKTPPPSSDPISALPTSKKKSKISSNQIAPSVEWSPDFINVNGERKGLGPNLKPIFISPQKEVNESEDVEMSEKHNEEPFSHERNGTIDKSFSGHLGDDLLEVEVEGDQNGVEIVPDSSSPPPYVMSISAWKEDGGDTGASQSVAHRGKTLKKNGVDEVSSTPYIRHSTHELQHSNASIATPTATTINSRVVASTATPTPSEYVTPKHFNGTHRHQTFAIPTSPDYVDDPYQTRTNEEEEENLYSNDEHYQMLQDSSTARLVTVSPAPKSQRAAFSGRGESKLGLVDARSNAYDYSQRFHSAEEDHHETAPQFLPQIYSNGRDGANYDLHVPESNIQMVRPAVEEDGPRAEVIGSGNSSGVRTESNFQNSGNRRNMESSLLQVNGHRRPQVGQEFTGRTNEDLTVMDLEEDGVLAEGRVGEGGQFASNGYLQEKHTTIKVRESSSSMARERQEKKPTRSHGERSEGKRKKKTKKSVHTGEGSLDGGVKGELKFSDANHHYSNKLGRTASEESENLVDDNARAAVTNGDSITDVMPARLTGNDGESVTEMTNPDVPPPLVARASVSRHNRVPEHTQSQREVEKESSRVHTLSVSPLEARATVATGDDNSNVRVTPTHIPPLKPRSSLPPLKPRATVATGDNASAVATPTRSLPPLKAQATVANGDENSGVRIPPAAADEKGNHQTSVFVDGSQLVKELPPLRVTSLLPSIMEGISVHPKRNREPPGYNIHKPSEGIVLSPPCPLYGEKQPPEADTLKKIRQHSAMKNRSQLGGDGIWDRPAWSRSKSVGVDSVKGLQRSSSTLVLTDAGTGSSLARAQSERDVSDVAGDHTPHPSAMAGFSPGPGSLHIAAKLGNLRRVQALLDQGHDVDLPDDSGRTPLMYCIQSNGVHLSCADALIKYGAQLDKQTSDGATVVHMACGAGALSLLELLLLNNARADVQDFEGRYPIHWATLQTNTKVFTLLLKRCGPTNGGLESVDDAGMTVLMWAGYHDNYRVVSHLMDLGADTQEKDKDGYTAMHWAIHREGSRSLQLLLKPDMTYFKDHLGKTLMHVAAERGSMGACEVVLKLRADAIHDRDKKGRTPLHYGAACSRVDVCALLLDYGADASQRDSCFKTPLDYAREKKLDYVVALLSCHGNAVADFARASRSVSVSSLLHRTISFGQLPGGPTSMLSEQQLGKEGEEAANEGEGQYARSVATASTVTLDNASTITAGNYSQSSWRPETPTTADVGDMLSVDPGKGGYLGRFFPEDKDLIRHYFFRLNEQEGSILWSRSRESAQSSSPNKALVLEVHREPSNTVRNLPKFSPGDLHCYTFWVGTSGGVLDLLAYNEDAYNVWLIELERVASRNAHLSPSALQAFKGTSVVSGRSRPVSSGGTKHTAKVGLSPSGGGASGFNHVGNGIHSTIDSSVFLSDGQNRNTISNHRIPHSRNANSYTDRRVPSKSKQVVPLSVDHAHNSSPSPSRKSGLSFVGETYRSARPDTSSHVETSLLQGTVI